MIKNCHQTLNIISFGGRLARIFDYDQLISAILTRQNNRKDLTILMVTNLIKIVAKGLSIISFGGRLSRIFYANND